MAELERVYNIPLRKEFRKAPKYKRANKSVIALRQFLSKHMKSEVVKLGPYLNSKILEKGRKNPPHHIEVKAVKEDGVVKAEYAKAKSLDFLKPKKIEEKEDKIKIPGLKRKKKEEKPEEKVTIEDKKQEKAEEKKEKLEEEKEEVLKKEVEKDEREQKVSKVVKDKEGSIMIKEEKRYGRDSKKTKVKAKK